MKKRKLFVLTIFVIVFGMPISWYLFLQIFGENKFDLPVLGTYKNADCLDYNNVNKAYVFVDTSKFNSNQILTNELGRIADHFDPNSSIIELQFVGNECNQGFGLLLVDKELNIRGQYGNNRQEVDRLLTEKDIYITNQK